jgi:succinate dehydrogenase/fumarate reductase cytochrome b subunit
MGDVENADRNRTVFGKIVVIATLAAILYNLGAGLYFMMVDNGGTGRTVGALTRRIGLSVALILFVMLCIAMGWIQPHGVTG